MKSPTNKAERNAAVLARYQDGGSYRGIAKEFGISAVRVQQHLSKHTLSLIHI